MRKQRTPASRSPNDGEHDMANVAPTTVDANAPPITRTLAEFVATHPSL